MCDQMEEAMKNDLSVPMYCAAQADIWSSRRMHGYFAMALSYISEGKLFTRLTSCRTNSQAAIVMRISPICL